MKRSNEVTVGMLITASVVVLVLGTLWLARGGLKSGYPLYTRFAWGQNLKQGQPVLLAGVNVGYVGDVTLRRQGYLDVLIRINDEYKVPKGSKATVKAIGIFGDVAVALTPPTPPPAQDYAPGDTVPAGVAAADVDQIMSRVDSIGATTSILLRSIQQQVVEAGTLRDIHKTVASAAALSAQLQAVIAEQNRNLSETMRSFNGVAAHLNSAVDSADLRATVANLRQTSANAARLSASLDSTNTQIRSLLAQAQNGNGTLGKLMSDSLLYRDIRHSVASLDSLLNDFKANPKKYINLRIF
jgi:phospholipid/cholesterol/gamma-HCH transport system substrate-binding protein